jgi:hypothetical protein
MFLPILNESAVLDPQARLSCPAQGGSSEPRLSVRDLEALYDNDRSEFQRQARRLAGNYAYSLGYRDRAGYHGLHSDCEEKDRLPIVADSLKSLNDSNSVNHGVSGQNVLYLGGNVAWKTTRHAGVDGDDIFLNWDHQLASGKALRDTVLGPGDASPVPQP